MKESDIRPRDLHLRYLALSRQDAESFNRTGFEAIACPGCGSLEGSTRFKKFDFAYVQCSACASLYCSPRPSAAMLDAFYMNSESSKYWAETFFPAVAEARREKIFRRRAASIAALLQTESFTPASICDVGAGYGILLEELRSLYPAAKLCAVEPGDDLAARCRQKGIETLQAPVEAAQEWSGRFSLVVCSEVIEHVHSTDNFARALFSLLEPGGCCVVTGLGFEGFDILSLMEKADSISPPHHLNFLSIAGMESLFTRAGFDRVSVSTPGELDLDIVRNHPEKTDFVKALEKRGPQAMQEFQDFLKRHRLSSHVWVLAHKPL